MWVYGRYFSRKQLAAFVALLQFKFLSELLLCFKINVPLKASA